MELDSFDTQALAAIAFSLLVLALALAITVVVRKIRTRRQITAEIRHEARRRFIQDAKEYFGQVWGTPVGMTHAERMRMGEVRLRAKHEAGIRQASKQKRQKRRHW